MTREVLLVRLCLFPFMDHIQGRALHGPKGETWTEFVSEERSYYFLPLLLLIWLSSSLPWVYVFLNFQLHLTWVKREKTRTQQAASHVITIIREGCYPQHTDILNKGAPGVKLHVEWRTYWGHASWGISALVGSILPSALSILRITRTAPIMTDVGPADIV